MAISPQLIYFTLEKEGYFELSQVAHLKKILNNIKYLTFTFRNSPNE